MSSVHNKTVVTADDGVSEVGSDEWNATHNELIQTSSSSIYSDHLNITTRLIAQGTGRLTVREPLTYMRGTYGLGSIEVQADTFQLQYKRASFAGAARAALYGNAELFIFDLAPVGRLVLAGRGG